MDTTIQKTLQKDSLPNIIRALTDRLERSEESQFWKEKVIPFTTAVLSILVPLRDQDLLFTPEGAYKPLLEPALLLEWMDFVSLRKLAFIIQDSNAAEKLLKTQLPETKTVQYKVIDLQTLAQYLNLYNVDLSKESLDFPIANYNIHQGVKKLIVSLLQE